MLLQVLVNPGVFSGLVQREGAEVRLSGDRRLFNVEAERAFQQHRRVVPVVLEAHAWIERWGGRFACEDGTRDVLGLDLLR